MKKRIRIIALSLLCCFLYQLVFPVAAYALTGGPSQPEVESFEPVGTSEMVDLFTGDFNYNIPLMDIDGYPINIAYHSGVTMDQEASWVGLGWNLNPGVINRNMRGIPDDFQGDEVVKQQYVKPDRTYGTNLGVAMELFGNETKKVGALLKKLGIGITLNASLGISYNNYRGLGIESRITPAISAGHEFKSGPIKKIGFNAQLDLASSSKDGLMIKPQLGFQASLKSSNPDGTGFSMSNNTSVGMAVSSRSGVKNLTIQTGIQGVKSQLKTDEKGDPQMGQVSVGISNGGSPRSFGTQTYTPAIGMQFENMSLSFMAKIGPDVMAATPSGVITGYYSSQLVAETRSTRKAYGALYIQDYPDDDAMLDFNREKDGSFSNVNPVLAIPIFTYDVYSASGQGIGGVYKPCRNDIPVVHDPDMKNVSNGKSLAFELAIGAYFKAGLNPAMNFSEVRSGSWRRDNDLLKKLYYTHRSLDNPLYEPVYFKNVGEKNAVDVSSLAYQQISQPLRPVLEDMGGGMNMDFALSDYRLQRKEGSEHIDMDINSTPTVRNQRDKRNQLFSYLTMAEKDYCLMQDLGYTNDEVPAVIPRTESKRLSNHLTEITVTNDQGSRYVYGIPAYNNVQYELSFTNGNDPDEESEGTPPPECSTGQVIYDTAKMDFDRPRFEARKYKGNDHAMNITKTPAYAHSYLLTAVLTPDYVDVDQNGPTSNDYGNYTRLSYTRVSNQYKWRVPYNENKANFSEGLKSDATDNSASIIYGEKEVWLVKKIEGKNHYAKFIISPREDGLGVKGKHGGKDASDISSRSYQLDRIELYSYEDETTPIKTVHFEYTYELCNKVDNNTGAAATGETNKGKLTLKKLYFTYGKSIKGRFNSYEFKYEGSNPDYNIKSYDRWGNYKPNSCASETFGSVASSVEYPYVDQDKSLTDPRTSAWSLTAIVLPSGGEIKVKYESDDYAYVQNRRAMQMVKIKGFSPYNPIFETGATSIGSIGMNDALYDEENPREMLLFDLPASLKTKSESTIEKYLLESSEKLIYYNCLIQLDGNAYEYVRGYTPVLSAGVINMNGDHPVGWIRVKNRDGNRSHPIAKSAWQYARMYLPYLVYKGSDLRKKADGDDVAQAMIRGILGFIFDAIDMIDGVDNRLREENFAKHVSLENSWIRINNMTGAKLGGGTRVKELTLNDRWSTLSGSGSDMSYGQQYSYTCMERYNGEEGQLISSGVASYEPGIGSDENPFKMPVAYSKDNVGVPNDEFYVEEPFGESYFPSPQVGYSRVTVKNYIPEGVNLERHGTGKVVHEFYTAREFPVITNRTDLDPREFSSSGILKVVGFYGEQNVAMSQGFQIELNDMHGKPKSVFNYTQDNIDSYNDADAFSGIKYDYQVENPNSGAKKLDNNFRVIDNNNHISTQTVGVEAEMVMDTRKQSSETYSGALQMNLDNFPVGGVPILAFSAWPDFSSEQTSYKSAVITRVINRYGLLKTTTAYEEGSSVATENILLDAETGATLLTKTYNEYNDPVYNMSYPAHWTYDGMGQAYKNTKAEFKMVHEANANFWFKAVVNGTQENIENYLTDGDEIVLTNPANSFDPNINRRLWVYKTLANKLSIIDKNGKPIRADNNEEYIVKVLRSGRRNMQNTQIMQFTSLGNPIDEVNNKLVADAGTKILNASALTFAERWGSTLPQTYYCNEVSYQKQMVDIFNYLIGSGQLTLTNVNNASTTIDTTLTNASLYLNSYIKQELTQLGVPHVFQTINNVNTLRSFGYNFNINNTLNPSSPYNRTFALNIPTTWTPVSIAYIGYVDPNLGTVVLTYTEGGVTKQAEITVIFEMYVPQNPACGCHDEDFFIKNPFLLAMKGNWRMQKSWVYYDNRLPSSITTTNIRKDGTYASFSSFYKNQTAGSVNWITDPNLSTSKWALTNEVTKYNPLGAEIENKDALGRYSAALYGYNHTIPVAVASNAKYQQIGFDGAEESDPDANSHPCPIVHLDFGLAGFSGGRELTDRNAHTGQNCYKLVPGQILHALHDVFIPSDPEVSPHAFILSRGDLNGFFSPDAGKKYVVGAWVKVGVDVKRSTYSADTLTGCHIRTTVVKSNNSTVVGKVFPSGPVIEGWQRLEGTFVVNEGDKTVKLELVPANESGNSTKFDDIRVHPYDAKMKSYVYDPKTLRLVSELDENNYATFYEYDAEGQLTRVKRETEKGIVTIKESRSHQHKK